MGTKGKGRVVGPAKADDTNLGGRTVWVRQHAEGCSAICVFETPLQEMALSREAAKDRGRFCSQCHAPWFEATVSKQTL